jgi:hypothetical protein
VWQSFNCCLTFIIQKVFSCKILFLPTNFVGKAVYLSGNDIKSIIMGLMNQQSCGWMLDLGTVHHCLKLLENDSKVIRSLFDDPSSVFELSSNYLRTIFELPSNYLRTTFELPMNYLRITYNNATTIYTKKPRLRSTRHLGQDGFQ